jgi:hypothetical protein
MRISWVFRTYAGLICAAKLATYMRLCRRLAGNGRGDVVFEDECTMNGEIHRKQ